VHHNATTLARYVPDLAKDKFHLWITKYHYLPVIALGLLLFALGGLPFLLWGIFLRTVVGLHATWLVQHQLDSEEVRTPGIRWEQSGEYISNRAYKAHHPPPLCLPRDYNRCP
jgi:hypothetical protein